MAQKATLSSGAFAFHWSMKWNDPFTAFSLYGSWLCKSPLRWGFPGGAVVKNPPANAGDTGSSPGLGRSHMPQSS